MAVAAGTGEPVGVAAVLAADVVEAERALAAQGEKIEGRIRPLVEPAGPEVSPIEKNAVDGVGYAVTLNSVNSPLQACILIRVPPRF
jgi:hypothetical protein